MAAVDSRASGSESVAGGASIPIVGGRMRSLRIGHQAVGRRLRPGIAGAAPVFPGP